MIIIARLSCLVAFILLASYTFVPIVEAKGGRTRAGGRVAGVASRETSQPGEKKPMSTGQKIVLALLFGAIILYVCVGIRRYVQGVIQGYRGELK